MDQSQKEDDVPQPPHIGSVGLGSCEADASRQLAHGNQNLLGCASRVWVECLEIAVGLAFFFGSELRG